MVNNSGIDSNGFTAREISKFLNRKDFLETLPEKKFLIMHEGDDQPIEYSELQMRKVFGLEYLYNLIFESYESFTDVLKQCPYLLRTAIGNPNRQLAEQFKDQLSMGYVAPVTIKWIDSKIGYGLFANDFIAKGSFVGEYTGLVRRLYRNAPDHNVYCFYYPTKLWSAKYYVVDALWQGNETRYINHSFTPNLNPAYLLDRNLLHLCFIANQDILPGTELRFNYGNDFWKNRH